MRKNGQSIRWKYFSRVNTWEGFVNGELEPSFSIQGTYCIQDLRAYRAGYRLGTFVLPTTYTIESVENGKQMAMDLILGENTEMLEANRLALEAKNAATAKLIADTDKFIKDLKKKHKL